MSTPAQELDFDETVVCLNPLVLGELVRERGPEYDRSGVVEWASGDTAIVVIRHVEYDFSGHSKVGFRTRYVWKP